MLRYDEAPVWSASRPIFRAGQNTRPTGDGGDRAEPAPSRKQDHPQPANTGNRINQTTGTALHAKRPADQTEWPNRNFNRKSNRHAEVLSIFSRNPCRASKSAFGCVRACYMSRPVCQAPAIWPSVSHQTAQRDRIGRRRDGLSPPAQASPGRSFGPSDARGAWDQSAWPNA